MKSICEFWQKNPFYKHYFCNVKLLFITPNETECNKKGSIFVLHFRFFLRYICKVLFIPKSLLTMAQWQFVDPNNSNYESPIMAHAGLVFSGGACFSGVSFIIYHLICSTHTVLEHRYFLRLGEMIIIYLVVPESDHIRIYFTMNYTVFLLLTNYPFVWR